MGEEEEEENQEGEQQSSPPRYPIGCKLLETHERPHPMLKQVTCRVEVFEGVLEIQHQTNLKVRYSEFTDQKRTRRTLQELHESDLFDWLKTSDMEHLLTASREDDLAHCVSRHAYLRPNTQGMVFETVDLEPNAPDRQRRYMANPYGGANIREVLTQET